MQIIESVIETSNVDIFNSYPLRWDYGLTQDSQACVSTVKLLLSKPNLDKSNFDKIIKCCIIERTSIKFKRINVSFIDILENIFNYPPFLLIIYNFIYYCVVKIIK